MERVTVEDVKSWSYRGLELFMLAPPLLSALFGVGLLTVGLLSFGSSSGAAASGAGASSDPGTGLMAIAGGVAVVWLLGIVVGLVSIVAIPLLLYLDAKQVADQGLDWEPDPVLYLVGGFFLSGLAVLHYLYKRHQYVIDWVGSEAWWYVTLVGFALAIVGVVGAVVNPVTLGLLLLAVPMVTIGIYKDATYVRLNSDWRPNPVNHFLISLFASFLFVPGVLYFGYFAYKRHSAVGLV